MSTASTNSCVPMPYRATHWVLFGVIFAALIAAFWWTGGWMFDHWGQEDGYYSHGPLIPLVSAFLFWRKRRQLAACPLRPCFKGLWIVIPALLAHLIGAALQIGSLSGMAMIATLIGLTLTLLGPQFLRIAFFPLLFLVFMAPVPDALIKQASWNMKLLSAQGGAAIADAIGLAIVRKGSYIYMPHGTLVVDTVCSGLKYVISLLAFGALYAYLSTTRWWGKAILFGMAAPVAVIANIIRVALMILVAYNWGVGTAEKWYFHDLFGFALFVVAFVLLFLLETGVLLRLQRPRAEPPVDAPSPTPSPRSAPSFALLGLLCGMAVASAGVSMHMASRPIIDRTGIFAQTPLVSGDWRGQDSTFDDRVYDILGTRNVLSRYYTNSAGERVALLIVVAQDMRKRTHAPEQCFEGEGFTIVGRQTRSAAVDIGQPGDVISVPVQELLLTRQGRREISWHFFKSRDRLTASYWGHQARLALSKLTDPNAPDIMIRVSAGLQPDRGEDATRELLSRFLADIWPDSIALLP